MKSVPPTLFKRDIFVSGFPYVLPNKSKKPWFPIFPLPPFLPYTKLNRFSGLLDFSSCFFTKENVQWNFPFWMTPVYFNAYLNLISPRKKIYGYNCKSLEKHTLWSSFLGWNWNPPCVKEEPCKKYKWYLWIIEDEENVLFAEHLCLAASRKDYKRRL